MSIRLTPRQNEIARQVNKANADVYGSGEGVRDNEKLDRKYHQHYGKGSWDTRKARDKNGAAKANRASLKADLEKTARRGSPQEREFASKQLGKIREAESREHRGRVTGRIR